MFISLTLHGLLPYMYVQYLSCKDISVCYKLSLHIVLLPTTLFSFYKAIVLMQMFEIKKSTKNAFKVFLTSVTTQAMYKMFQSQILPVSCL